MYDCRSPGNRVQAITALAKREKLSQAEVLRRAVRLYLETCTSDVDPHVFEIWQGRPDGLSYQQRLRDEWER